MTLKPISKCTQERSPSNFHIYDIAVYSKSDSVYHDLSVYNKRDYISHLMSYTNVLLFLCVRDVCLSGIFLESCLTLGRNHTHALFVMLVLQRKRSEKTPASSHRGETFFNVIIVTLVAFTAYLYSKYHFISHHRTHTSVLSFFCDSDLCLNDKICLKNYYITHTGEGGSTQYTVYIITTISLENLIFDCLHTLPFIYV